MSDQTQLDLDVQMAIMNVRADCGGPLVQYQNDERFIIENRALPVVLSFTKDEYDWFKKALAIYPQLSPEAVISALCEQVVIDFTATES